MLKVKSFLKSLKFNKLVKKLSLPKKIIISLCKALYVKNKGNEELTLTEILFLEYCNLKNYYVSATIVKEFYKEKVFKTITNLFRKEEYMEEFNKTIKKE